MLKSAEDYGDILLFRVLNKKIYFINHPDLVKHVLHTNYRNYKKSPGYKPLSLLVGNGIFTNDGEEWLRRRKLYQPAFNQHSIRLYVKTVISNTEEMLNFWAEQGSTAVNASMEMTRLTMAIISESLFSMRISFGSDLWKHITYALGWAGERALRNPFVVPVSWPTPGNRKFREAVAALDEFTYGIIAQKKRENLNPEDLLSRFMHPEEEGVSALKEEELRDEVMTIFLAGHETSANVLSWALYILGSRPEVQQKMWEEVKQLGNRELQFEDLHQLTYTTQVVSETMRLYPPVWHLGRQSLEDDQLGDYFLPAGSYVRMSPLTLHRRKDLWKDPETFDPDRFHSSRAEEIVPNSFIPFGAGPRLCAGRNFAMMEMVLILAMTVRRFSIDFSGTQPELAPGLTLRADGDIQISVFPR